jgi:GGDEF domain-containing protein
MTPSSTHGFTATESAIVDIARDFLTVHRELRAIAHQEREGALRFEAVRKLVGDDEGSVLFRLKEHCHALFRGDPEQSELEIGASALFDLAVGSLFHEAMKLRENLYQSDVYAPKAAALRASGIPDASGLLAEFDKLVKDARSRLSESVAESSVLLRQTTAQFRVLLRSHASNRLLARFVVENAAQLAEVFGCSEDEALAELYGNVAAAWRRAAWSYLTSGFFSEATRALSMAAARGDGSPEVERQLAFANGMTAYLAGRYGAAIEGIAAWADAAPPADEVPLASLAASALGGVRKLAAPDTDLAERAGALADRLRALTSGSDATKKCADHGVG